MTQDIQTIIEAGNQSPSGDNSQPWRFEVEKDGIRVVYAPRKPARLFDYNNISTIITLGCVAENMLITARFLGYDTSLEPAIDETGTDHSFYLRLKPGGVSSGENIRLLRDSIKERHTNRYLYRKKAITTTQQQSIDDLMSEAIDVPYTLRWLTSRQEIKAVASAVSCYEYLLFSHHELHDELYQYIRWTEQETNETKDGFDARTLGFNWFDKVFFKALRSWGLVRLLNYVGLSSIVSTITSSKHQSAGAYVGILMSNKNRLDGFTVGRVIERFWLGLTSVGLAAQPTYTIRLLDEAIAHCPAHGYSDTQIERVRKSRSILEQSFSHTENYQLVFLFRVGVPKKTGTARALRREPDIIDHTM